MQGSYSTSWNRMISIEGFNCGYSGILVQFLAQTFNDSFSNWEYVPQNMQYQHS